MVENERKIHILPIRNVTDCDISCAIVDDAVSKSQLIFDIESCGCCGSSGGVGRDTNGWDGS